MVCDDCFETDECRCGPGEMCGSCFESKVKPEDASKLLKLVSEPECNEVRINGKHCFDHGAGHCCACHAKEPEKPECQHPNKQHTGSFYDGPESRKTWLYYTCPDCKAKLKEEMQEEAHDYVSPAHCKACMRAWIGPDAVLEDVEDVPLTPEECNCDPVRELDGYTYRSAYLHAPGCPLGQRPEEPPLTFEEEEQAPEDRIHPADCVHEDGCQYMQPICENGCKVAADELVREASENACEGCLRGKHGPNAHREPPPPQPERRPPYLVAYSVSGHLFEVALPGDATVRAVDGALVIQHHLGPVAGIVSVLPVINKESA